MAKPISELMDTLSLEDQAIIEAKARTLISIATVKRTRGVKKYDD